MSLDFNHPTKSLLEQEQELLNMGHTEEDLNRLYSNVVGNGHPDVCLCPTCAPMEYEGYDFEVGARVTVVVPARPVEPYVDYYTVGCPVHGHEYHDECQTCWPF